MSVSTHTGGCASTRAATSQHSLYGEQFEVIVQDELRRRLVPLPSAMEQSRVLSDVPLLEQTKTLLAGASGYAALADSYTAQCCSVTRGADVSRGLRALRFEELEADIWAEVAEGAAEPLLAGQCDTRFRSWRMAAQEVSPSPHGAGVLVVEATTSGAGTIMRLKLLKLEHVLAYAEAEGTPAVCAFLAVQQPDQAEAGQLSQFICDNQAALPRVWVLSSAGSLGFISIPEHCTEYITQVRAELDSVAEEVQRLNVIVEELEAERQQFKEQVAAELRQFKEQAAAEWQQFKEQATAEWRQLEQLAAAKRQQLKEQAAARQRQYEEQAAARQQQLKEQAAARQRQYEEQAAARQQQLKEQAAARQRQLEEQAAAWQRQLKEQAAAKQQRVEQLAEALAGLQAAMASSNTIMASLQAAFRASGQLKGA